jgi:hypothetical protein
MLPINYGVVTPAGSAWSDKLYFSQSPLFNINTAIQLKLPKTNGTYYTNAPEASVAVNSQLPADSFYTRSVQVVVPNFISGTWFIYVVSNATGTLYEGALNNNNLNRYQQQVFLTPTPHLTVSAVTLPVTTASTTQLAGVSWIISNTGFTDNIEKNKGHYFVQNGSCTLPNAGGAGMGIRDSISYGSSYWVDRVYLSTDSTGLNTGNAVLVNETSQGSFGSGVNVEDIPLPPLCQPAGSNPAELNLNTLNVIKPGSNHPQTAGFTIPSGLQSGNYYVYVLTNAAHTVYEYPGTPETRRSALPITIQRPDVVVSALTASATATGGQSFAINYSVLNNGPGTVFSHIRKDMIYVSNVSVFNASAQLIDSLIITEGLPVGTATAHTLNYTFPASTSGTRYLYVLTNADSVFRETNSGNNISAGLPISVTAANR